MADPILLDWTGTPIALPKKPESGSQAESGRVADKWASVALRDVNPETLARVARNTASLQDHASLCDKIYLDASFLAAAEDYIGSISGLEWDVLPYVDSPGAEARAEDKNVAESIGAKLYNSPGFTQYIEHITWGDGLYPLHAAETIWDPATYLPARFELVDAVRFNQASDNTIRLLTAANSRDGEPLKPANWTAHSRNPQNPRKSRMHKALAFYYMCARFSVIDWLSLSEKFGKPIPMVFFQDGADRDALVDAAMQIGTEFVGVFPDSVRVELTQAIDLKGSIQQGLTQFGYDQATKLITGHVLVMEAKPGSGTLGGNGAQITSTKKTKAGASRIQDSIRQGLMRPLTYFHHGEKAASRVPYLVFKVKEAEDGEKKGRTMVAFNEALAPLGLAIAPEHIQQVGGIPNVIVRPTAGAAPSGELISQQRETMKDFAAGLIVRETAIMALKRANVPEEEAIDVVDATEKAIKEIRQRQAELAPTPAPGAGAPKETDETEDADGEEKKEEQRAQLRPARQASKGPQIRKLSDVVVTSTLLGARGEEARSSTLLAKARQAADAGQSVREFLDSLFEQYDSFATAADAELLAQGMVVSEAIGAGKSAAARPKEDA